MRDDLKVSMILLIGLVILLLFIGIGTNIHDSATFNNGICSKCGGHYVYQQALGHQYSTSYVYKCEKCGKLIEVSITPSGGDEVKQNETD